MSEDTVFKFKIKYAGHIEDVEMSREICGGEYPTTDTLSQLIETRTGIPKKYQKLIVAGRLIRPGKLHIRESLHQFCGRSVVLLGCTEATVARMREQRQHAELREDAMNQRLKSTADAFKLHKARVYATAEVREEATRIDTLIARQLSDSEALRAQGRRFGIFVPEPILSERNAVEAFFGTRIVPAWFCPHISIPYLGCVACCDQFLIEWFVLTHERLETVCLIRQLQFNHEPNNRTKVRMDSGWSRLERLKASWALPQPELEVLLEEIERLEQDLDFPPDEEQHLILSPHRTLVLQDYESLQVALDLLYTELDFDADDIEEGEVAPKRLFGGDR